VIGPTDPRGTTALLGLLEMIPGDGGRRLKIGLGTGLLNCRERDREGNRLMASRLHLLCLDMWIVSRRISKRAMKK
jgi:hypothetical protein